MKAKVNKDTCIGCGVCEATCPDVFHMNDENIAEAIEGDIPDQNQSDAEEAKDQCPTGAIEIE